MVALYPWPKGWQGGDGRPHIALKNMAKYNPKKLKP